MFDLLLDAIIVLGCIGFAVLVIGWAAQACRRLIGRH